MDNTAGYAEVYKDAIHKDAIRIGILINRSRRHYAIFARRYDAHSVHVQINIASARFIVRAHKSGLRVFVYTVNSFEEIDRLWALGVDGIFTDFPELVIAR